MKLPSSSSLLLASLAISSSSSSLSALAAPAGDCPEDSSSPAPVPHGGDGTVAQSNNNLQTRSGIVGAVNPDLEKALRELLDPLMGAVMGPDKETPKARAGPLDLGGLPLASLVPAAPGVKVRASGAEESGADTPKDSPTQPSSSSSAPQATASSEAAAPAQPAPATPATPAPKPPVLPNPPSDALPAKPSAAPHPGRRDSVNGRAFPPNPNVLSPDLNHIVPTNTPVQP